MTLHKLHKTVAGREDVQSKWKLTVLAIINSKSLRKENDDGELAKWGAGNMAKFLLCNSTFSLKENSSFHCVDAVKRTRKPNRRDHALHNPFVLGFYRFL
jgi:hypothetical protein